jgi:RND family efflux transporter MFP subunit
LAAAALAGTAWLVVDSLQPSTDASSRRGQTQRSIPVEVAEVERGPIELLRSFTGTLDARAEFVVAPKVSGRIEELAVDLADTVHRGQVVAQLDNDEFVQAVNQAQADLEVARANLGEAQSQLAIAERELTRIETLRKQGVGSEAQRDTAKTNQLAKQAALEVTKAQVARARAALETARIRLGYTHVTAGWTGGDNTRVVAARFVDEGETVSANAPLLRIVELDPLTAVFSVTERDYALLETGQTARLTTDAYPRQAFEGQIERIAPVFQEDARQARVELRVDNARRLLKPGMFVRVTVVLDRVDEAAIVPEQALTERDGRSGVFTVVSGGSVAWRPVETGIRQAGRVQITAGDVGQRVVTLGQQQLQDGARIVIANGSSPPAP